MNVFKFSCVVSPNACSVPQSPPEEPKGEKKSDQPPQAKKPKVKTKLLELPIENSPQWQLADDMLNLFVENEVTRPLAKLSSSAI